MRLKPPVFPMGLLVLLIGTTAWADQIILKEGTVYSGKFVRGDSQLIDFRILGRIESFKTSEISRLVFEESETGKAADSSASQKAPPVPPEDKEVLAPVEERPRSRQSRLEEARQSALVSTITVPKGMALVVRTTTEIDTDRNRVGDAFEAILDENLVSGTQTVAPRGSLVKGRIAYSQESGRLSGQSQLVLELTELVISGKSYPMRTSDYTELGTSRGNRTAAAVGGTAAVGAIIGAIAGGGRGAAIGAASGAAVGTGVQVITRGQILRIPAETILEFRLESPLTVDAP